MLKQQISKTLWEKKFVENKELQLSVAVLGSKTSVIEFDSYSHFDVIMLQR
jgi:hypothetical protein